MNNYLNSLKEYLIEKEIDKKQIEEVINDYKEFYDEYLENGLTDDEIILKLGSPREVYNSLKGTLIKITENSFNHKIVGISPFLSVISYILLGYFFNAWHPAWVVFLSIPLSAVFFNNGKLLKRLTESLIFIGIIVAVLLPYYDLLPWKFSWLFFISFLLLSPFAYSKKSLFTTIILEISLLLAIILYIILVLLNIAIPISLLGFVVPLIVGIYTGDIEVSFNIDFNTGIKKVIIITSIIISLSVFIVLGLALDSWAYIWQVLLLPIMISIIVERKNEQYIITSLTPFLATIIFFSLGYFYSLWAVSWLAYLLIPLIGVLEGKPIVEVVDNADK